MIVGSAYVDLGGNRAMLDDGQLLYHRKHDIYDVQTVDSLPNE